MSLDSLYVYDKSCHKGIKVKLVDLNSNEEKIFNSLNKNKVTYVVGDFNAYEERGEMKSKPSILRGVGYNSFIPSSVITDYKDNSSIDNFYVDKNTIIKNGISVEVKKTDLFVSDHACCTLDIPNP